MMSAIGFKIIQMTITEATVVLAAVAGVVVMVGVVRRVQMKLCCYC